MMSFREKSEKRKGEMEREKPETRVNLEHHKIRRQLLKWTLN